MRDASFKSGAWYDGFDGGRGMPRIMIFGTVGMADAIRIFSLNLDSGRFFIDPAFAVDFNCNFRCFTTLPAFANRIAFLPAVAEAAAAAFAPIRLPFVGFDFGKSSLLHVRFGGGVGLNGFCV